jgi:penicillin-binding protein 1A
MRKLFIGLLVLFVFVGLLGAGGLFLALWHFGRGLPNHQQLAGYEPPVLTRVHAGDGRILAEFAVERRVFVPIDSMPKLVINAFLSAEDKSFYSHPGISLPDIARAAIYNAMNRGTKRPIGASTITQQVAKNFLLTNEVSLERKVKEAILAVRIEQALTKDRILELYLNEIYLGQGAYGVAAAALNYFNKPMDELTVAEAAYLAALPKAPNNYHPVRYPEAAKARRDWVITRMREDGVINDAEAEQARRTPFQVRGRGEVDVVRAEYFAEEVRRELLQRYGEAGLYGGGLSVRTTVDPKLQDIADRALRKGLITYDRRHGWRGPVARIDAGSGWDRRLQAVQKPHGLPQSWALAVVLDIGDKAVGIGFADGKTGTIPFAEMQWARQHKEQQRLGPPVRQPGDVLHAGDVVAVEAMEGDAGANRQFTLRQIPNVSGGIVALDPHTGRVLAMAGGWSFELSQFNRVTQAVRQPGSAFKPFVYLPALDNGFTPSSLVLDAPIVINQGPGLPVWKPSNYSRNFFGPSPIRVGIEQSRNLMTIRLAQNIGIDKVADYVERFGIVDHLPEHLSMSLGAGETTLLKLTTAYAMLVNGGLRIKPTLIDRVQDRNGKTIFKHDPRPCESCRVQYWGAQPMPALPDNRERVIGADTAFQMVNILQGVVDRGTGRRIKEIGKPLAGKTGTTNDSNDAWFVGFAPDLAVGVFIGFDTPKTLGPNETGSSISVPIFKDVMAEALKDKPAIPFRIPPGIRLVRVNPATGLVARPGERDVIWEAFKPGSEPMVPGPVLDGGGALTSDAAGTAPIPASDTGGLY